MLDLRLAPSVFSLRLRLSRWLARERESVEKGERERDANSQEDDWRTILSPAILVISAESD